ncbi:MAG: glycosyltransferase family 2 protein [Pyrinomonadaceae bacterium]|nr:glycosyltransferase family 2 protein [Sphingobacteriaceae bacterium]
MKIIAVIVTYNRLELLKKCVKAVNMQTLRPDMIIVINNGSTDETKEWLSRQDVTTYTQENIGGAGGFSTGVKMAYAHGTDWIWLMDDDTISESNALQQLQMALIGMNPQQDKVGFLSSSVLWTDGNTHEMNRTYLLNDKKKLANLSLTSNGNLPFIQFGTFVSMLLSSKAVEKVGLPIKEFFIWSDDVEYSKRIIGSGLAGIAVNTSVAIHETPTNHLSNVFKDTDLHLWKYKYGLRNELYIKRLHTGELQFWITWIHRMFIMPFRIIINRKTHRWSFIKVIWQTSLEAIFFRPAIEKV